VNTIFQHFKSHRKDLIVSVAVGFVVGLTIVATRLGFGAVSASQSHSVSDIVASAPTPSAPLMAQSQPSEVVALMLNSHNTWTTIDASATTIWHSGNDIQTVYTTIQIKQFAQVRLYTQQFGSDGSQMFDNLWVSDGESVHEQDAIKGNYSEYALPLFAQSLAGSGPQSAPQDGVRVIYRHPIAMVLPSPLADYIYPTGLMQREGKVTVVGTDEVAGRKTISIMWENADADGAVISKAQYWVDSRTGMILKAIVYGGVNGEEIFEETTFTSVSYDGPVSAKLFAFQPAPNAKRVSLDEFMNGQP